MPAFQGLHPETSSLFVLYARQHSLPRVLRTLHPSPTAPAPKHHCRIVSEEEEGDGVWGWNSPPCQSPSKQTSAKAPCVQTIQLKPTQCILRPYLGKAKYTLSYQRQWMSDWNSWFFGECKHIYYAPPLQAVQIKIRAARRKNKHHAVRLLRNLENRTSHIAWIGPEVYKTPARPSPADAVVIRSTSDRVNAGKDFFKIPFKGFAR